MEKLENGNSVNMGKASLTKKKIANFELQELIGSGGMANIYKGIQLSLDRPVAIKILHPHLTLNQNFVVRFEKEAKQVAQLAHPNIVAIIEYGNHKEEYFIAMEYIDGQNLKEIMTRLKRLPLEVALLIIREIGVGLKYAHSSGLIHRDIKPANIMISSDGRVMITDFGIARNYNDLSITVTGQMIGSPAYMSPEQAAGQPIDHRCDIFSLGIALYEIVTGKKPFKGDSYQEVAASIVSGDVVPPGKLRIDVTPEIENVVMKALKRDIESRYQDAGNLAEDLDSALEKYNILSSKKLISEFLKNPIRTAEKLRANRISKHMESALYLVNLGHGRIDDAIKEFNNVLRYDKNNKLAKEHLYKLKSSKRSFSGRRILEIARSKLMVISSIALSLIIVISLLISLMSGKKETLKPETGNAKLESFPASVSSLSKKSSNDDIASIALPPLDKNSEKTSGRQEQAVNNTSKSKKNVATKKDTRYNYPNQNISKFGSLEIVTVPAAVFSVDAKEYGLTGGPPAKLEPGRHTIVIKKEGFKTVKKRVHAKEGKTESISVELKPDK